MHLKFLHGQSRRPPVAGGILEDGLIKRQQFFQRQCVPLSHKYQQMAGSLFSCFGFKKKTQPPAPTSTQFLGEAKRISQEAALAVDDTDFALRIAGFDNDDPEMKAAKEERVKRRSQEMEAQAAKRKSEEEAFIERMQRL